jgi:prepilin-type N-terminal cleavage/methylation domain-containing protein
MPFNNMNYAMFKKGFTLPEVLLSILLIGIIAGMSLPVSRIFLDRNELDQTVAQAVYTIRRAQAMSIAGDGDSMWGVRMSTSSILLFKGSSYASRDQSFDESISIAPTISFSGFSEVVFQKGTGAPFSTGTSTFTLFNGEIRTISINQKGMVSY